MRAVPIPPRLPLPPGCAHSSCSPGPTPLALPTAAPTGARLGDGSPLRSVDSLTPTCRATADGRLPSLNNRAHSALLSGVMIRGLLDAAGRKKDDGPALRLCPTQLINVRCGFLSGALSNSAALTCPFSIRRASANLRPASSPAACEK